MSLSGVVAHKDDSIPTSQPRHESKFPQDGAVKSAQHLASVAVLALDPTPPNAECSLSQAMTPRLRAGMASSKGFTAQERKDPTELTPEMSSSTL